MVRYLAKFIKGSGIKFISHLDLMRTFQRAIRRAGLPISYSKGFNPHADISFATPLSVGTWSTGEYLNMELDEKLDEKYIMEKMNDNLPGEIRIVYVKEIDDKLPALMAIVAGSSYQITIVNIKEKGLDKALLEEFIIRPVIEVTKYGKNGEKIVDIKPMIRELKLIEQDDDSSIIYTVTDSGSKSNLNPELIVQAMRLYIAGMEEAEVRDIKKLETFVISDGRLISPIELIAGE